MMQVLRHPALALGALLLLQACGGGSSPVGRSTAGSEAPPLSAGQVVPGSPPMFAEATYRGCSTARSTRFTLCTTLGRCLRAT
jgi:hypothetical protein